MAEIDGALLDGGDYPALQALRAEIENERSGQAVAVLRAQERRRLVEDLKRRVASLRQSGKTGEALEAIAAVWEQVSGEAEIAALRNQIEGEQQAAQREERFRTLLQRAEGLLSAGRAAETITLLESAAEFVGRPTLVELTGRARERVAAQERERAVESAEAVVRRMIGEGKYDDARHAIQIALQRFPGADRLADLRREIAAAEAREAQLQAERIGQARARLLEIEGRLSSTPARKLPGLSIEAARIAAGEAGNRELAAIAANIGERVNAMRAAAPAPGRPKRWIAAGAAALLLAVAAIIVAPRLFRKPAPTALGPATFLLEVRADPAGSAIRVNGQTCRDSTCRFDLPASTYTIHAEHSGYRPADRTVALGAASKPGLVTMSLEPEPPPAPPAGAKTGVLAIRTGVPESRVMVDGRPAGLTNARGELSATVEVGAHAVRVEKAGYSTEPAQRVTVEAGRTQPLRFDLTPEMGQLQIQGAPAGAEVRLGNGASMKTDGAAAFRMPAAPGQQILQVRTADGARETPVRIEAGGASTVEWAA
ncbi:MAG TPA: PEGA domain-containing protein, partial [Opitutaceae bacterium]|nr:PEGA domain-containing protein [Opitutaceae bacterium]